jgi:hypothetical protein
MVSFPLDRSFTDIDRMSLSDVSRNWMGQSRNSADDICIRSRDSTGNDGSVLDDV